MLHTSRVIRWLLIFGLLASTPTTPFLWSQTREETSLWDSIKDSKDAEDYKAYLDKYPEGTYAPVAKRRVAQFETHPSNQTTADSTSIESRSSSKSQIAVPVTMKECEGTDNCATWTFLGSQGNGQWPSGDVANLSVERYDTNSVVIHRADSTGPSAGLTAVYKGTRKDDRVGGEFTSSWPGHWQNKSGNWYATVEKETDNRSVPIPKVMHFCAQACVTLVWDKDHFGITSRWTVESFTRDSVIIHRVDESGFTALYTGQISKEGNSIINAGNGPGHPSNYRLTWGSALDSIPGSGPWNGPAAPVVTSRPVVCYPWFWTVVCQ